MSEAYQQAYQQSINDPEGFWGNAAEAVTWIRKWDKVLDDSNAPFYQWFQGGVVNTCYNAVDRHVENGRGEQLALIYDSPVTDTVEQYTYHDMHYWTAKVAGMLAQHGVTKGDRVIIYM